MQHDLWATLKFWTGCNKIHEACNCQNMRLVKTFPRDWSAKEAAPSNIFKSTYFTPQTSHIPPCRGWVWLNTPQTHSPSGNLPPRLRGAARHRAVLHGQPGAMPGDQGARALCTLTRTPTASLSRACSLISFSKPKTYCWGKTQPPNTHPGHDPCFVLNSMLNFTRSVKNKQAHKFN